MVLKSALDAFGKLMFQQLKVILNNDQAVTGFQLVIMIVITVLTLVYTMKKASGGEVLYKNQNKIE